MVIQNRRAAALGGEKGFEHTTSSGARNNKGLGEATRLAPILFIYEQNGQGAKRFFSKKSA